MQLSGRGVYAITDGPRDDLLDAVRAALAGGARVMQYRDKTGDQVRRLAEASALAQICREFGVPMIVNDDIELAAAAGASGVHLGLEDGDLAVARARLGASAIIGVTCHSSFARARQLAAAGADYLAFGAFYPSPSKPGAPRADLDILRRARALDRRLVAIGGISADNAPPLIAAGADFLAVISSVFGARDIEAATRRIALLFS